MGFTTSSKNIHLRAIKTAAGDNITNLCADCKDENGNWNYREVTLDWPVELTAGGAVLLCTMDGSYNHRLNTLALDLIFHSDKGDLVYQLPPKNVRSRLTHLTLRGKCQYHFLRR
ncbi:hypothetical protein RU639_006134 [Aspergillus parasiticus]